MSSQLAPITPRLLMIKCLTSTRVAAAAALASGSICARQFPGRAISMVVAFAEGYTLLVHHFGMITAPALSGSGPRGFDVPVWHGLHAPKGTPLIKKSGTHAD